MFATEPVLIGVGSILLQNLEIDKDLSELWESVKATTAIGNYERFVLGLDLLYLFGLVEIKSGKITKVTS